MDLSAIAAAMTSVKTASEIAKGLVNLRDEREFQARAGQIEKELAEARGLVAEAQTTMLALLNRVGELERQVAQQEDWRAEAARYELVETYKGRLAYRVKDSMRGEEPTHYVCPACFQKRQKSILQPREWHNREPSLECPACEFTVERAGFTHG